MEADTQALIAAVRHNCHIADANHAQGYTLCVYLLKMREYYRWEKGYAMTDSLPADALGEWLDARERLWDELRAAEFSRLPLAGDAPGACRTYGDRSENSPGRGQVLSVLPGNSHSIAQKSGETCTGQADLQPIHRKSDRLLDPFDSEAVNRTLLPRGLVYSGGYGGHGAPHFFLGQLLHREARDGFEVRVSGTEHARDLAAPPAMLLGDVIYVRRESLRRLLWERIEEWNWKRGAGPMQRALAPYGFERDALAALEAMTDHEIESAILHELGECQAGRRLGDAWNALLTAISATRAELVARAVRDHLADSLTTLPTLLERDDTASLDFYFANYRGMRRELYPELLDAYRNWREGGPAAPLRDAVAAGRERWEEAAARLLALYREHGENIAPLVENAVQGKT